MLDVQMNIINITMLGLLIVIPACLESFFVEALDSV
jgi:hypothetical protein